MKFFSIAARQKRPATRKSEDTSRVARQYDKAIRAGAAVSDGPHGDQSWQELKALLEVRINAGLAGKVSAKSVDEVFAEELETDKRA